MSIRSFITISKVHHIKIISNNNGRGEGVVFCKAYQQGSCSQTRDHYGQFYGQNRLLKHICGKCWLNSKTQVAHPETSEECPLKEEL